MPARLPDDGPERVDLELDGREVVVRFQIRGTDGSVAGSPLCSLPVTSASIVRDADGSLVIDIEFRGNGPTQADTGPRRLSS